MGNGVLHADDYVYRQKKSLDELKINDIGGNKNEYLEMEPRGIIRRRNAVRD